MFAKPVSATTPLKVGFLCPYNPYDRLAFSGTASFAAQALEHQPGIDLRILGSHRPPGKFDRLLRRHPTEVEADHLDLEGLDAVVGLVATPLMERLGQTHPQLPLFHVTDATPAFLRDAYGWAIPPEKDLQEKQVAAHASATIYSSEVMARRAAADLDLAGLQPNVIPFGVNLDELPQTCPRKPPLNRLKLLFVGLDWVRKGGDVALAAVDQLNASGHFSELTVVGRCPERHSAHPAIVPVGFLNKTKPRSLAQLNSLYRDAHLLLLPSRGDCTPMVVAEAMAYGTPVLATDTGGIREQIGGTGAGRTLPALASPRDWAETILEMTSDPDGYALASDASFDRSRTIFSWDRWAKGIENLVRENLVEKNVATRKIA